MSELPIGWTFAALGDLCRQPEQRIPAADEEFIYIDIASVDRNLKAVSEPSRLLGSDAPSRARKIVNKGDVIVSMTRPNLNAVALIDKKFDNCIASTGFDVLKPIEVDPRWVFYSVRSSNFIEDMCQRVQGALYPAIKTSDIREYQIPLPPISEQTRIAQKLDELLAQVDTLKARIDAIPALLKRFRQSVLAAAVSGRLTEDWRSSNVISENLKFEAGKFLSISSDEKYDAPINWEWARIGQASKLLNGDRGKNYPSKSEITDFGVPFINAGHIGENHTLSTKNMNYITREKFDSLAGGKINPEDLVFCLRGTVGKVSSVSPYTEGAIASSLVIIRTKPIINNKFAFIYLRSPQCTENIKKYDNGTAQPNLSASSLSNFPVAIPPQSEQTEIVRRVEQLFAFADQLEAKVATAKARIDRLTQSILAKAFRGELVPQDPNDEPASVLLERIQAQRAAAPKARRGRKATA